MDNTELHYVTYDPNEIWNEMIDAYLAAGGDFIYPGDEKEILLRSVQADIIQVFAGVDNALRMQTLRYAVGAYLDAIGETRGCDRIKATAAEADVIIEFASHEEAITIPEGTSMTADGVVFYSTTSPITVEPSVLLQNATVRCDTAGVVGNGLTAGTVLDLASPNEAITGITVENNATGGADDENDDAYRERIRTSLLISTTTGSKKQYESVAKSVSSHIIDVQATTALLSSVVDVYLLFDSSVTAPLPLQSEVYNVLNSDEVRPLTDIINVSRATNVPYVINVSYVSDGSSAVETAIQKAISDYKTWQEDKIARKFTRYKLMADMYAAGATYVEFGTCTINGSSSNIDTTEPQDGKRYKGTITATRIES